MGLIAAGATNSLNGAVCFDGDQTVKNHCDRVFTTLNASSRSGATALWLGTAHAMEGGARHDA